MINGVFEWGTNAIFTIRQISWKALEYSKLAFLCLVGVVKAFDSLQLKPVLDILEQNNVPVPDGLLLLIKNNSTEIKVDERLSSKISVKKWIRKANRRHLQCGVEWDYKRKRVKIEKKINIVCYSDNTVSIAGNEDCLKRLLYQFSIKCHKFKMRISTTKTKIMIVSSVTVR